MAKQFPRSATAFIAFIAILTWLTLILQLYLMIRNRTTINGFTVFVTTANFFSYFTILTNSLVALSTCFILLKPSSSVGRFFSKPVTLAAITLYIFIVGLTYNILLRATWAPTGLQKWIDEALHSVIPLLFIIFWLAYVPKGSLKWFHPFRWLIYPGIYLVFALLRGEFTGFHPYYFINAVQLGYPRVLLNAGGLMLVFIITGLLIVALDKSMGKRSKVFS
jgi:hypothetical protein